LLEEAKDFKISLVLVPQSYDYSNGEIVYRIFVDNQLISERSLPVLNEHEALCDTFVVKLNKNPHNIFVKELGDKKIRCKKIIINDVDYGAARSMRSKNFTIRLDIAKRNK
jgi:hypothetical protein